MLQKKSMANKNVKRHASLKEEQPIFIHPFWDEILTQGGSHFTRQYGKTEIASIYYLQGKYWNPGLSNKLYVGDRFTIAKEWGATLSEYRYKVMNKTILKICPKSAKCNNCNEDINENIDHHHTISKKYASGMLFKYKGIIISLTLFFHLYHTIFYFIFLCLKRTFIMDITA